MPLKEFCGKTFSNEEFFQDVIRNSSAKLTTKSFTKSDDKRIRNFMKHQRQK